MLAVLFFGPGGRQIAIFWLAYLSYLCGGGGNP